VNKIIQVFLNISMQNQHDGLAEIAMENDVDVKKLKPGQLVVFINSEKTKLKVFGANGVLAYFRSPHGRIEMQMIQHIPEAFSGGGIDFKAALKVTLEQIFEKKRKQKEE
jgi:hypothetical protein